MNGKAGPSPLPAEVRSHILTFVDLPTLLVCSTLNREWHSLTRSEYVATRLCWRAGYIPIDRTIDIVREPANGSLPAAMPQASSDDETTEAETAAEVREMPPGHGDTRSAYELSGRDPRYLSSASSLYKSCWILDRVKRGQKRPSTSYKSLHGVVDRYISRAAEGHNPNVWRHKIDPIERVIIATHTLRGGLGTTDLDSGERMFWEDDVPGYAHLEFSQGWAIHNTLTRNTFQLWSMESLTGATEPRRGHLVRAGTIDCPRPTRAYRFIWPYLAVACAGMAYLFDVRTQEIAQEISLEQDFATIASIGYIEFDQKYVFVLGTPEAADDPVVNAYSRRDGHKVWDSSELHELPLRSGAGAFVFEGNKQPTSQSTMGAPVTAMYSDSHPFRSEDWTAVHPDARTGALCISSTKTLVVLPEYDKWFRNASNRERKFVVIHSPNAPQPEMPQSILSVSDGIAAFIGGSDGLISWFDIEALIKAPQSLGSMIHGLSFSPGQVADASGLQFFDTSCVQLDATRLSVIGTLSRIVSDPMDVSLYHAAHSEVFVIDFQKAASARLATPNEAKSQSEMRLLGRTSRDEEITRRFQRLQDTVDEPSGRGQPRRNTRGEWGRLDDYGSLIADSGEVVYDLEGREWSAMRTLLETQILREAQELDDLEEAMDDGFDDEEEMEEI